MNNKTGFKILRSSLRNEFIGTRAIQTVDTGTRANNFDLREAIVASFLVKHETHNLHFDSNCEGNWP